tara:strand:- start:1541 stop:2239 length:699 start_codon:yes stop_codon:yes gene_type:complete
MGRYKSTNPPPQGFQQQSMPQQQTYGNPQQQGGQTPPPGYSQYNPNDWPKTFTGPVIGIDRDGVILEWKNVIKRYEDMRFISGSIDAIRSLRLKGHRVVLFSDQPNIERGLITGEQVGNIMNNMMQTFGQNGIFSIDGFYFNQSSNPQDPYAKPNIGMLTRASQEAGVNWKTGYYVGDTIDDIKMAQKAGATPVLVRTGKGAETEKQFLKGINTKYKDVKVFDNLAQFVDSL